MPKEVDQHFDTNFDEALRGDYLREHLKTGHLSPETARKLIEMIKKHWHVFDLVGVRLSVIGYECGIDTSDAKPVSCRTATYGPRESNIMKKHIITLLDIYNTSTR